jgi:hypothetical protein
MCKKFIVLFFLMPAFAFSQNKSVKTKPQFQLSAGVRFLAGEWEPSAQLQLASGLKMNNWFVGIGGGVDDYRFRTVPIFFTTRRHNLFSTSLFVYADAGVSLPWNRELMNDEGIFSEQVKFYTGFYSETGIGYRLPSKKRLAVQFSAGYSFRAIKEKVVAPMLWSSSWPTPNSEINYHHRFHLVSAGAAVVFNHRK